MYKLSYFLIQRCYMYINKCLYAYGATIIVTGSEKRGHFAQIPNFGYKMLITLKL